MLDDLSSRNNMRDWVRSPLSCPNDEQAAIQHINVKKTFKRMNYTPAATCRFVNR
jgi:hypothetical protein